MENSQVDRIETLLQIIADELFIARTDREYEGASGSGPELWEKEGRDNMVRTIEHMYEELRKSRFARS
jgi:hypothetical protein